MKSRSSHKRHVVLYDDPTWYKDAIIYEVHLRAFKDSNGDGIGDWNGLTDSLDYLQDLGITAIWILPFYPSPLRDGGYDIAEYTGIHEAYGTLRDFRHFMTEAHRRGLRVITELVLNHTSNDHAWFQRARRARDGSKWRSFYVWSDDQARYADARIIFKDYETSNWAWDPVAKSYYWHRFYSHQPDLNFDNPDVRNAMLQVVDFWCALGVDGLRLDAVPYLFEREGTNCENLPETHGFLRMLRAHIDENWKSRMLLAEANQWPIDAAAYFGAGDECHMNFHFPLMPRMFMAVELEDSFPIVNILNQTPKLAESCQWATFLRNHDELTLEMVTDEDRDYMVRAYAQDRNARINLGIRRRLAPLLKVRSKIELMNVLLMSLPGTPVLYYGDEIGMGDNIYLGDRDGVRTPMQWSADANAGFSRAKPQQLYLPVIIDAEFHYQAVNVETQQRNTESLLWWMKRLLALRKQFQVFGRGTLEFLHPDNGRVIAFLREYQGTVILVVGNLSRFAQFVELDLSRYRGRALVELWGRTRFPSIGENPYGLSLGSHGYYWFHLEPVETSATEMSELPNVSLPDSWLSLFDFEQRRRTAQILASYFLYQRSGQKKQKMIESAAIVDIFPIPDPRQSAVPSDAHIYVATILQVTDAFGRVEKYFLALGFAGPTRADELAKNAQQHLVARLHVQRAERNEEPVSGVVFDALALPGLPEIMIQQIAARKYIVGEHGRLQGWPLKSMKSAITSVDWPVRVVKSNRNTAIVHGDRFVVKYFGRLEDGPSVEREVGRFLTRSNRNVAVPRLAGTIDYREHRGASTTVALVHHYIANWGDAFQLTQDAIERYFDHLLREDTPRHTTLPLPNSLVDAEMERVGAPIIELMGAHHDRIIRLAVRTAELHLALATSRDDPAFTPEPFTPMHQQSLFQSAQNMLARMIDALRRRLSSLNERERALGAAVIVQEQAMTKRLSLVTQQRIEVDRIRCHGDFHLQQALWTGDDFVIIDFEGDRCRPISERRYKRCPLRDVAWMVHSFHDVARKTLFRGRVRPDDQWWLENRTGAFVRVMSAIYVRAYLNAVDKASFIPRSREDVELLLHFYRLEKCIADVANGMQERSAQFEFSLRELLAQMEPNP